MTGGRSIFAHPYRTKWLSWSKIALKPLRELPPEFPLRNFWSLLWPILYCDFALLRELFFLAIFLAFFIFARPYRTKCVLNFASAAKVPTTTLIFLPLTLALWSSSEKTGCRARILEQFSRNHRILGRTNFFQKFLFEVFLAFFFGFFVLNSPRIRGSLFNVWS